MVWSTAMLPPAPARFSTTTCWPTFSARNLATTRATVSVPPPGSKPTTIVIGLLGYCASAEVAARRSAQTRNLMSFPREDRLAFFHERLAAFLVIGAVEAFLDPRAAQLGVVVLLHHLADDALGGAHGERRVAADVLAHLCRERLQLGDRHHVVHQPHLQRLGGGELPRGEHDLARVGAAHRVD